MRIRITSDLHTDINKTIDFGFNDKLNEVDLNIIAGDIAGSYQSELAYLSQLDSNKPIVCVAGNHLGYDYVFRGEKLLNPLDGTKLYSINRLREYKLSNINYLENEHIIVKDKIIFGGTMYTDFNLYGNSELHKKCGESGLNDFRYVFTFDGENIRTVTSEDYQDWFRLFLTKLESCIEKTNKEGLDIIVVTHFAPSVKSISSKYNGRYQHLNPSYASNLEQFILNNSRIKLWVHGHMHDKFDYKIGQCRVVCHPYGYNSESNYSSKDYFGKVIRLK